VGTINISNQIRRLKIQTVKEVLFSLRDKLKSVGIPNATLDAQLIIADTLGFDRLGIFLNYDKPLGNNELSKINARAERRLKREPIAYILGKKEFCSLDFKVSPAVLIPRPETEYLVELVFDRLKTNKNDELNIIDIGTGCGCIAITLAKNFPNAKIIATDTSEEALALATENSVTNSVDRKIKFLKSNLFNDIDGKFDLIISNPPYVAESDRENLQPEILHYEPITALIAPDDGFGIIKKLINEAPDYLKQNSLLAIETGDKHREKILLEAEKTKRYRRCEVIKDLNGLDRYFFGEI